MNVRIVWHYQVGGSKLQTSFTSDELNMAKAVTLIRDIEKTGRMKDLYCLDDEGVKWTKKELEKLIKGIETEPHDIVAFFDGGFDRETKRAGLGIVVYFSQNGKRHRLRKNACLEQLDSNNEAEYAALLFLLQELEELGAKDQRIEICGDSQVVIGQVSGVWPVYEEAFSRFLDRIEHRVKKLGLRPHYEAIGRKENREADQLAGQALKETPIESRQELVSD